MEIFQCVGTSLGNSYACGAARKSIIVTFKFKEGSTVFSIAQARKGILEAVFIRNVRLRVENEIINKPMMYYDNFNWLWNESELCSHEEALSLTLDFLEKQRDLLEALLGKCS